MYCYHKSLSYRDDDSNDEIGIDEVAKEDETNGK